MARKAIVLVSLPHKNLLEKCVVTQDYGKIMINGQQVDRKAVRQVAYPGYDYDVYRKPGEKFYRIVNDAS